MRLLSLRRHSPGLRVLEVQDQDGQVEATGKQIWAQLEEQSVRSKDELDDSCALTFLSPRDALVPQQCSQGAGLALSHPHFFFFCKITGQLSYPPILAGLFPSKKNYFPLACPFFSCKNYPSQSPYSTSPYNLHNQHFPVCLIFFQFVPKFAGPGNPVSPW